MSSLQNDKKEIVKISHSKVNTYIECPQKFKYIYIDKLRPTSKNASLYFGSAIDLAVQEYLHDMKSDWKSKFEKHWLTANDQGRFINLYDSLEIDYSYKDFDKDLLTDEDIKIAEASQKELLPSFQGDWLEAKEYVTTRKKQRAHVHFTNNEHRYFNRLSWLSMKRKGILMTQAFVEQIGPKIKKVLMVQKRVQITSDNGDILTGYVDMVLDIEDHGVVIFDLKTAAQEYDPLQTLTSQQLGIYASILGAELNTYKVGYIVLLKNIEKDKEKICSVCGHKGEGSHKKCDAEINGKRCNGEWNLQLKLNGRVQVLTEELTEENMQAILDTVGGVTHAIKENLFYRNSNSCLEYGGCPYAALCWKGKMDGLVKDEG
jgi:PD-(D/E)XK nuclease superfamily